MTAHTLEFHSGAEGLETDISDLFFASFASTEGPEEAEVIKDFVAELMENTSSSDLFIFTAQENQTLLACACFSRISFDQDPRTVFILSPAAVLPGKQKRGIGTSLLQFSLDRLRSVGVDIVLTYGDPAFYTRIGFQQIVEAEAQPPFELSQPHGWMAKPLSAEKFEPIIGGSKCVSALNRPELW